MAIPRNPNLPIWSGAWQRWGNSPYGQYGSGPDWENWAPWYQDLTRRIGVTEAGPDVRAAEIYNQMLPFLHPRDMQKYLDAIISNPAATSKGQPLEAYNVFNSQDPSLAKNWEAPRRLTMREEYNMSKSDKVGLLADMLLGEALPISGEAGDEGPFTRPGDENLDSLTGGLLEVDDSIRPYVEALLRTAGRYAPGGNQVGSRRSMAQQADYQLQFQDAMSALQAAEESEGSQWGGNYVSNILEAALEPGYYRDPAGGSGAPSARQYRYLFDQYKPYRSSYYY